MSRRPARTLEFTPAGILASLAVFAVVAVCVRLGFWQLDRRAERLDRNAVVAERMERPPVTLDRWPADTAGLTHRRARLTGRFDPDASLVLAGRSYRGAPGVHLLSPLRLPGTAVLVNRGWMPAPDGATVELDAVRPPGTVEVEGVLLPFPEVDLEAPSRSGFRQTWYRFHGDAMRAQSPYPLAPLYLQATARPEAADDATAGDATAEAAANPTPAGRPMVLPPPTLDPGPHLSYAIQWFSFAAIFLIGWLVLVLRRERSGPEPPKDPTNG